MCLLSPSSEENATAVCLCLFRLIAATTRGPGVVVVAPAVLLMRCVRCRLGEASFDWGGRLFVASTRTMISYYRTSTAVTIVICKNIISREENVFDLIAFDKSIETSVVWTTGINSQEVFPYQLADVTGFVSYHR